MSFSGPESHLLNDGAQLLTTTTTTTTTKKKTTMTKNLSKCKWENETSLKMMAEYPMKLD